MRSASAFVVPRTRIGASMTFFSTLICVQAQAHQEAVALFRTYAGTGDDQELAGFARETLPSLETHLAHVTRLVAQG